MACLTRLFCGRRYRRKTIHDGSDHDLQVSANQHPGNQQVMNGSVEERPSNGDDHGNHIRVFQCLDNPDAPQDMQITVSSSSFRVHKQVLCKKSEYFRAMFDFGQKDLNNSPNESVSMQTIELKGDTPTTHAFLVILNFMYFGKVELNGFNAEEVIAAANFLFVTSIWSNFADIITLKNWKSYLSLADKYHVTELKDLIYRYLNCNYSVLQGDMSFHKAKVGNATFSQGYLSQFRDSAQHFTTKVIAVAGFYKDKLASSPAFKKHGHIVSFYDARTSGWKFLAGMPPSLRSNNVHVDITGWDDTIYAVGGKSVIGEKESCQFFFDMNDVVSVSKTFSYNTRIGEWKRFKSPSEKAFGRTRLLVTAEKTFYLLHDGYPGCYRYDAEDNMWHTVSIDTRTMRDCCYGSGVVYLLCRDWGLSSRTCHISRFYADSQRFNENLNSEQVLPSGRCTHMTSLDDVIYVIDDAIPFNCFIFRFDPATNTRTLLSSSPIREFGFKEGRGAIGFHGCVYYLGEHKVAAFDIADLSWKCLPPFPANFDPKSIFVLTVPRDLAQVSPDIL